jgi:apolipoprotein N-acyltransferase
LKNAVGQFFLHRRYPLALVAGLFLAAAFPKIGIAGFAWIAPALMLATAIGQSRSDAFRLGYVAGLAYYLTSLYWLLLIPYRWHSIPLGPAAGWLALGAYLALYPAIWVWLVLEVQSPKSKAQSPAGTLPCTWAGRTVWAIAGAATWVALEMVVARLFSGFPWNLLGASQYQITPLLQIASFTGIYGVSFLVVWLSLSFFSAALMLMRRPASRSIWVTEIFLPMAVLAVVFKFGFHQLTHAPPPARTLRVTCVQPSIPQTLIWDESKDDERFRELIQLSEQALTNQTDLLLWPEAAIPKLLQYDQATFDAVTGLARNHHVWLIVGADDMALGPDGKPHEFYNSSFLISPEGKLVSGYKKRNLVIFGEYIPLVRWLPFMKWFTPIPGGFTPGQRAVFFELGDLKVKTSPLICFEDMFPQLARDCTEEDTDFLVNMTNDGWFGESAEPWQHAATAVFRAVENGRPLLRCTNTGLTCWIDAQGRLRQIFRDSGNSVYGPGFMTTESPLLAGGERHSLTFYNRHGDWFGWACVGIAGLMLLGRLPGSWASRTKQRETQV